MVAFLGMLNFALVVEGMKDGLWSADSTYQEESVDLFKGYDQEVTDSELNDYLGVKKLPMLYNSSATLRTNSSLYQGDFPSSVLNTGLGLGLNYELNEYIGFNFNYDRGRLEARDRIDIAFNSLDLGLRARLLGAKKRSPYLNAGLGSLFVNNLGNFTKFKLGLGLEQYITKSLSLNIYGEWNQLFSDGIDGLIGGRYTDYYYQFGLGVNYHFDTKRLIK